MRRARPTKVSAFPVREGLVARALDYTAASRRISTRKTVPAVYLLQPPAAYLPIVRVYGRVCSIAKRRVTPAISLSRRVAAISVAARPER